ncbi:MAG: ATP-binding cassette domain-containing protein [Bacteroidales bacterium]|nr:ATP-binding cassette domain-containing protein [Bacteroidales bacterium]
MENNDNTTVKEPVVALENVVISYGGEPVLKDVSLRLEGGDFAYLIGKSGAGKTSLLRTLYADLPVESGVAKVCGFDVVNIRRREVALLRRKIGIVFQNFRLLPDRSVRSNLEFVLRATGWKKRNEIQTQIDKVLGAVGVADKADMLPTRLSEGQQQRVGIARAIINNPQLIVADEPTGNLDPVTSAEIMQLLLDINKNTGTTMLISTHDFMMMDRFPARVLVCENGGVTDTEN